MSEEHPKESASVSAHATNQATRPHYHNPRTGLDPETVEELLLAGWMSLEQVHRAAGVNSCLKTMKRWAMNGCSALDGRKLGRSGRGPASLWWGKHIRRIALCLQQPPEQYGEDGYMWVRTDLAIVRSGYGPAFLSNHCIHSIHNALEGKRLARRKLLRSADGHNFTEFFYFRADQLAALKKWKDAPPREDWLSARQLREVGLRCSDSTFARRRNLNEDRVEGQVRAKPNPRRRRSWLYHWGDIESVYAYRYCTSVSPFCEKDGKIRRCWCPAPWFDSDQPKAQEIGFARYLLIQWKDRGCPYLEGQKLDARELLVQIASGLNGWVWFFREDQLRDIKRAIAVLEGQPLVDLRTAAKKYRLSQSVIDRAHFKGNPRLKGKRLPKRKAYLPVRSKDGKMLMVRKRRALLITDVEGLATGDVSHVDEKEAVTFKRAAELAGVSRRRIQDWLTDGYEDEGGGLTKLTSVGRKTIEVGGANGPRLMDVEHLSRAPLDRIIADRAKPKETRKVTYRATDGSEYYRLSGVCYRIRRSDLNSDRLRVCLAKFRGVWKELFGSALSDPPPFKKVEKPKLVAGQHREWGYLKQVIEPVIEKMLAEGMKNPADALRVLHREGWNPPKGAVEIGHSNQGAAREQSHPTAAGGKQSKRRGRPQGTPQYDSAKDARIFAAWANGDYLKYADLDNALGEPLGTSYAAIERHRKRRN